MTSTAGTVNPLTPLHRIIGLLDREIDTVRL